MSSAWGVVIPLALGSAISPAVLTLQLLILSGRRDQVARAWAFTLGIAATIALFIALVATIGRGLVLATGNESMTERAIKALAAVGLLALGIRALRRGPRPESHHRRMADAKPLAFVPVGFATMWLNLSSLVLMLPAVHVAVNSSAPADQVTAMLLLVAVCALAPALLPALLVTVMGRQRSEPMLHRLNTFTQAHSSQINAGICFLFAVLLTFSAIRG